MRNRLSIFAGLVLWAAALIGPTPAGAMALPASAALKDAADALNMTETVHCRSVWRCGYYGCGWRRVCWAPPGYGGYYGGHYGPPRPYFRPYSYYGGGPYYRPYHRPYVSHYGPGPGFYRPYGPPPWVSGPYFVRRAYWY